MPRVSAGRWQALGRCSAGARGHRWLTQQMAPEPRRPPRKLGQTPANKAFRLVSRIRVVLKQMGSREAAALNIIELFIVWLVWNPGIICQHQAVSVTSGFIKREAKWKPLEYIYTFFFSKPVLNSEPNLLMRTVLCSRMSVLARPTA